MIEFVGYSLFGEELDKTDGLKFKVVLRKQGAGQELGGSQGLATTFDSR